MQSMLDSAELGASKAGSTISPTVSSSPFRWRSRPFRSALLIGFFVALAKQSSEPSLRLAGNIYTTIFRGLPELLTLFLVYYGVQIGLQKRGPALQPSATIDVNSFVSGMVALGVVFSSYASEVFLSAFRAIPRGQYEGGYSIGLTSGQTMRLVVLPQLIRIALPGLANLWLILLKDTALVSAIGLSDTSCAGRRRRARRPARPSCSLASPS